MCRKTKRQVNAFFIIICHPTRPLLPLRGSIGVVRCNKGKQSFGIKCDGVHGFFGDPPNPLKGVSFLPENLTAKSAESAKAQQDFKDMGFNRKDFLGG